jgi:2-hydroxymethylglutarate dehydrogenase
MSSSNVVTHVAQLGAGEIGSIFVGNLLARSVRVSVYDANPARLDALPAEANRERSIAALAGAATGWVLVSLPDPAASQAALGGESGLLRQLAAGTVVLDLSTIDPPTACSHHATALAGGVHYVEAPVSGGEPMSAGVDGARNGNVTFMAGSDPASFQAALPLMRLLGQHPLLLGAAGTGATVKLLSNHISGLVNLLCAEAFAVGKAAGVSAETLYSAFAHTDANTYWLFNYFKPRLERGVYEPGFTVDLQYKDLRLMEDLARSVKAAAPFNALGMQVYQMLRAQGQGQRDLVQAFDLFCAWAGVDGGRRVAG